jgi:hypothetical protein
MISLSNTTSKGGGFEQHQTISAKYSMGVSAVSTFFILVPIKPKFWSHWPNECPLTGNNCYLNIL